MALPARLKSALRPIGVAGKAIGPTGIGVLLSVGAHVLLLAASAQGSSGSGNGGGLFSAFDEAGEEKIVPIVQLTPAERSRLPAFAQPRPDPLSSSSLSSLELPPGLLAPNSTLGQRRTSIPAGRMPSTTTSRQFAATPPIDDLLQRLKVQGLKDRAATPTIRPQPPLKTDITRRTNTSEYIQTDPPVTVPSLPTDINGSPTGSSGGAAALGQPDSSGLPQLNPQSTQDILAGLQGTQGQGSTTPGKTPTNVGENGGEPTETSSEENVNGREEGVDIAIENGGASGVTVAALDAADGDPAKLQDGMTYDSRLTSNPEVAEKIEEWSNAVVASKGVLPQAEVEIPINSELKACRTNPPTEGLMGVIVNPGGETEAFAVLKSTGYETLNSGAQQAIEDYDFSDVNKTTEYRVKVKVNYDAASCVDLEGLKKRLTN